MRRFKRRLLSEARREIRRCGQNPAGVCEPCSAAHGGEREGWAPAARRIRGGGRGRPRAERACGHVGVILHPARPGLEATLRAGGGSRSAPQVLPCWGQRSALGRLGEGAREAAAGSGKRSIRLRLEEAELRPRPARAYAVLEGWRRGRAGG